MEDRYMNESDYIAIASIVVTAIIAIIGGIYAVVTNSKKYELAEEYKRDLISWYEKIIIIIMEIVVFCDLENNIEYSERRKKIAELSALIEIGRFYFPNIDKKDGFGKDNSLAYQGYRHIALEFLVYIHDIAMEDDFYKYKTKILELEKEFTSCVYELIAPDKRKRKLKKYTDISMPKDKSIEDFLKQSKDEYRYFNNIFF
ncbi:hypothetical protein QYB57_000347 [Clostridium perfringens]|uniref:hypothetical protein n=2 Tax=Clostridium perfringens TaxID=1502 RepID=UPI0013E3652A|nr:hypothetical protein [Clostridium perfringens]ELC8386668.1 hypothetical protein [Clostridium perfringens]ELC8406213.1 hypothetical protein [Clostridium perfringens]NGT55011.1 hypothetical protein [Clostridium perfringens]